MLDKVAGHRNGFGVRDPVEVIERASKRSLVDDLPESIVYDG